MTLPEPPADPSREPMPPPSADSAATEGWVDPKAVRRAATNDLALRWAGGVVAVVAAVMTAILELLWSPLRVGGELIGLSVVLAVVANVVLAWFARQAVGHAGAVALPAVAWFLMMMVAATRTREGDILLLGNWVGGAMIIAGSVAFAAMAFRMILVPGQRSRRG
ncbi:MAG TPA: hypothetical protein VFX61_19390 [Micromonosporaceae bacterium]|nr:hypothetical protein [Micromonosporaceae bacterium]